MNTPRVVVGPPFLRVGILALGLCAGPAPAQGLPGAVAERVGPAYELVGTGPAPLLSAGPMHSGFLRLDATAQLAARHELRLTSWTLPAPGGLETMPGLSLATLSAVNRFGLDPSRATYRYTFLAQPQWAWKVGVSTNLREVGGLRSAITFSERVRFGALPLLHVGGEGMLSPRWRLAFDADGLMTPRGRAFDLGLRVNYSLTPNLFVFGGYRLTDSVGEAEEHHGNGVSNAANVGMRYRF